MRDLIQTEELSAIEAREKLERTIKRVSSASVLSMFAFGLSGCLPGFQRETEPTGTLFSGNAIDGPLQNAKVFIDANNNGLLDLNETFALTSSDGSFSLRTTDTGNLAVVTTNETIDTSSGSVVSGLTLAAPSGSSIISPATTIVEALIDSGVTEAQAYADTAAALGLTENGGAAIADPESFLKSFNPFSSSVDSTSEDALNYATKSAQIVAVANTVAEVGAAANVGDKADILASALSKIATDVANSGGVELAINSAYVGNVIDAATNNTVTGTLKDDVSAAIANVAASIELAVTDLSSDTSGDLFYASQALLVEATVEAASGGSNDVLDVLKNSSAADMSTLATSLVKVTGSTRGSISEDANTDATTGDISTTGTLTLGDPDTTDDTTYKFDTTVTDLGSNTGSLTITEDGVWTYTYPSADVAALNSLQSADAKGSINDGLSPGVAGYQSDDNFTVKEAFKVKVVDSNGGDVTLGTSSTLLTKTIIVQIDGANDAVTLNESAAAIADIGDVSQNDAITSIDASGQFTDPDSAEKLTYSLIGGPTGLSINEDGIISGAPDGDSLGEYSITIKATDTGSTSATTTEAFKINVQNVNDAPALTATEAVTANATEDSAFSYAASALFRDPDIANNHDPNDALTYTMTGAPSWLSIDSATGALSGTPENADVASTVVTITATDAYSLSASQEVTVTVANTNDAPEAAAVDLGILRDTTTGTYSITDFQSGVTDVDVGDTHTLTALSVSSGSGSVADNGDGTFTYTPVDGTENVAVTFSYTIADAAGSKASSTATLQVVDAIPVGTGEEDGGAITVTSSDYTGATYTLDSGQDTKGTYDATAGTFTPAADFNGAVNFTLNPSGGGDALPAIVVVSAVNDDPVVDGTVAGTLSVTEDTAATGTITATDVDGDTLTYTYSTPSKGTITDDEADGTFTYTPTANANGSDSFTITVNENGTASSVTHAVAVTIASVADAPTGDTTKALSVTEDTTSTGNAIGVTDGDGDSLTFTYSSPSKGTIAITDSTNGVYSYVPSANATGTDNFTWTVSDGDATTADFTQTVSVTIEAVNDDPTLSGSGIADQNATSTFTLSDNLSTYFSDADGDSLTYTASSTTGSATASDAGVLSLSGLTPGTTTVTVTASDGKGGTDATDSFDLTVLGDLITYSKTQTGNTYSVDLSLNQSGVATAAMESVTGFEFTIGGTGVATSSNGLVASDDIPPLYASVDDTTITRDGLTAVTSYTSASNFQNNIFVSSANWEFAAGDAVPIISEASSWTETISGTEYDLISKIGATNSIGKLTFTLESDVTDFDLTINGTISGYDSSQNPLSAAETITAVTIDIV